MRKCVETVVIVVMSVVLMAVALTLMRPYGMAGVATAFTIAGVYMALMVLIVTARCCARRDHVTIHDPEEQVVNDSPPPYEQVVTKPPSYRTLFQPASARSFKQDPAIASHLGLADQLGKGVTPVSVFTIARSLDVARLVDRPVPAALPLPDSPLTPRGKERTPRRVRFSFEADMERKEEETNERPDGEAQEAAASTDSSSQDIRASQSTNGSSGGAS